MQKKQHELENKSQLNWESIRWKRAHTVVEKLQRKIFKYSQEDNKKAMKAYQTYLVDSFSAKLIAVRKVTQDNRGKRTAGIDGIKKMKPALRISLAKQIKIDGKASKIRRIYISKPGSQEKRPLGIPTLADRAKQALLKMALEPEWEAKFEANSYGFRPGRSCQDAIVSAYLAIKAEPQGKYILDADISKCFEKIDHKKLLEKLDTTPRIQKQILAWLEAGVQINYQYTEIPIAGTPQGGVISPLLANIALHGMETHLKEWVVSQPVKDKHGKNARKRDKIAGLALIRYADDFLIIHKYGWVVKGAKDIIEKWLSTIGLQLNKGKTQVKHTNFELNGKFGVDFLGFRIRRYKVGIYSRGKLGLNAKTLIKPSSQAITNHRNQLKNHLKKISNTEKLIMTLNPVIRGWCYYYRSVVAKETYGKCWHNLYLMLMAWGRRKHPSRSKRWIYKHYFIRVGRRLVFGTKLSTKKKTYPMYIKPHSEYPIIRHVKVKENRSVYDGDQAYWSKRILNNAKAYATKLRYKLLKEQHGKCNWCQGVLHPEDIWEIDHIIPKAKKGSNQIENLQLIHGHCHDQKHN